MAYILGAVFDPKTSIWGCPGLHFGVPRLHFSILGLHFGCLGLPRGPQRGPSGVKGGFSIDFGCPLGPPGGHFGTLFGIFCDFLCQKLRLGCRPGFEVVLRWKSYLLRSGCMCWEHGKYCGFSEFSLFQQKSYFWPLGVTLGGHFGRCWVPWGVILLIFSGTGGRWKQVRILMDFRVPPGRPKMGNPRP